jgi:hypothetical protein
MFGGLATLLAAVGLYGVLSYSVSQADSGDRNSHGARRDTHERAWQMMRGSLLAGVWGCAAACRLRWRWRAWRARCCSA